MNSEMGHEYLLIGCGNHGERLLKILVSRKLITVVCETNKQRLIELKNKYRDVECLTFVNSLENIEKLLDQNFKSIVCSWASERLETLKFLKKKGCSRVYLEKPFASNIDELNKVKKLFSKNFLIVPSLPQNFSPLYSNLENLKNKYKLGELNYISFLGGAKGLINNGIHYLDSSLKVIESNIVRYYGEVNRSKINPRKNQAHFYEGNITFSFKNNRYINIIMTNNSMLDTTTIYNFKFGKLILNEDGNGNLEYINFKNRENLITRTSNDKSVHVSDFFGDYLKSLEKNFVFFLKENKYQKINNFFQSSMLSQEKLYKAIHSLSKIQKNKTLNTT
tara:strand:- start:548 stop:1552 length:1005 start_codon:yes stop_codon:yes gene_type:complete